MFKVFITIFLTFIIVSCSSSETKEYKAFGFGTEKNDVGRDAVLVENNLYIVGLENEEKENNMFLYKLDVKSNKIIKKELLSLGREDSINGIASIENNIFVVGSRHIIDNENDIDEINNFIIKFDINLNKVWEKSLLYKETKLDSIKSIIAKKNKLYIATEVNVGSEDTPNFDILIMAIDQDANITKSITFGTNGNDSVNKIKFDNTKSNIYILGNTSGAFNEDINFGEGDALIMRVSDNFEFQWGKTFGTSREDLFLDMSMDEKDYIYVLGSTHGMIENGKNKGEEDIFVSKLNIAGTKFWIKQFGTDKEDTPKSIWVKDKELIIVGHTEGEFDKNIGKIDIFNLSLNLDGEEKSISHIGTEEDDLAFSIVEYKDDIFLLGNTKGALSEKNYGGFDLFKLQIK